MLDLLAEINATETPDWRKFVRTFLGVLIGGTVGIYLAILLVDPYADSFVALPLKRSIVSISQRFMYPQIVRSKRFDSLIVGTSTSRLIDPEIVDKSFHARFANLAMDSAEAWEQEQMVKLFLRVVGPPKVLIVGLDTVWCDREANRHRVTFRGFPDWLYDDNPWNDYLYLLNSGTVEIAGRLIGYNLGLYHERVRDDGYENFLPPESRYDPVRAHATIWRGRKPELPADVPPPALTPEQRRDLSFPALRWLDDMLAHMPASEKILVFMPVHVAGQPVPGTFAAAAEAECKARVVAIARRRGAKLIDWRIPSPLTRNDLNYWDNLHYRVPIATRITNALGPAALEGRESTDGSYRLLVR